MNKTAIILANGSFPKNDFLIQKLKESEFVVCCDGAVNKLEKINKEPFAIIGDLDSLSHENKLKYKNKIYHITEQDTNDLTKTVNWCINNGFTRISILGATGEREDHTIGNIFLLMRYVNKIKVNMITDYGIFTPIIENTVFDSFKGQQVSIFSPFFDTKITTDNLKYPLSESTLPELWNGTLNESLGNSFTINIKGKGAIIFKAFA